MSDKNKFSFPDPNAPKPEKDKESFGLQLGRAILGRTTTYRELRDKTFSLNRMFANGRQPIQPYLDQMDVDGKHPFTNIRFKPRPIAQKFHNIVVDGYAIRNEKPDVTSLSKHIKDRKEKKRTDAMFRMDFNAELQALSEQAGIPIEDPNAFVPENVEELDLYMELNDKELEEILMQQTVAFALEDNKIQELKRRYLSNIFINNLAGIYNYLDKNGRLQIEVIDGEDMVYGHSTKEDFGDTPYKGRFIRLPVSEVRSRYKMTPDKEKSLYEAAKRSGGKYDNPAISYGWQDDFRFAKERPYDGQTVELFHFWWKCTKTISYIEGKDRYNREVFDISYELKEKEKKGRKRQGYTKAQTSYEGVMLVGSPCMLEWGESRNILRKGEDREEVLCPFIFRMPNNDGTMLVPSPINNMIDSIEVMDLTILKIKDIIAKAAPDGLAIDVMGLADLDLGEGVGIADPMTLAQIYRRTGDMYYTSRDEEGRTNQAPIVPQIASFGNKLSAFLEIYNSELAKIRDYLGVNEFRDGSATDSRIGFRFAQAQLDSSNTATHFIYQAYISSGNDLIKQIGQRVWDSLVYGTPNKGYLQLLGKHNAELLKKREDITASSYDFTFKLQPDESDRQVLEQNIQVCLANGSLEMPDAIMIREIDDLKLASRMLTFLYNKRRKERLEEAQANAQMNAEANSQASIVSEQAKQQTTQLEGQVKMEVAKIQGEEDRKRELEKAVWQMIGQSQETGRPIPPQFEPLVELVMQNMGIEINMETEEKVSEIQQQQAQAEQLAIQQQQQQPQL